MSVFDYVDVLRSNSVSAVHSQKVVSTEGSALLKSIRLWKGFKLSSVESLLSRPYENTTRHATVKNIIKDGENGEFVQSQYPNQIKAVAVHDEVLYLCTRQAIFAIRHKQDCCEDVWFVDGEEDISDMVGDYLVKIRIDVSPQDRDPDRVDECSTWTFVTIQTLKNSYSFRWRGESNGYYSETVQLDDITKLMLRVSDINSLIYGYQQ